MPRFPTPRADCQTRRVAPSVAPSVAPGVGSGVPVLVVLFPPAEGAEVKWHKMWGACTSLETRFAQLKGRVVVKPPVDEWREGC